MAELDEAERRYLAHLADRHHYLQLKGMGINNLPYRLPLLEVFVPLHGQQRGPDAVVVEVFSPGKHHIINPLRVQLLEFLKRSSGLVILGNPGSGKSTLLKSLALRLAAGDGEELGLGLRLPSRIVAWRDENGGAAPARA